MSECVCAAIKVQLLRGGRGQEAPSSTSSFDPVCGRKAGEEERGFPPPQELVFSW